MSQLATAVAYEEQSNLQNNRGCGAACLSMIYRSFGKEVPQDEIWPAIAKQNPAGSIASTTHLMAADALSRGLAAVAIQARHPLQALRLCQEAGIHVILNHRLHANSAAGHYTVMVDLDTYHVVLHDPSFGPSRRLTQAELLALWQPHFSNSEIVGNVLIAIGEDPPQAPACRFCHTLTPPSINCPRCNKPIALRPSAVLGCVKRECIARMWSYICCPSCDFMLDSSSQPVAAGVLDNHAAARAPSPDGVVEGDASVPSSLNKMFEAMDKFCHQIQSLPGPANHADLQEQLQILTGTKAALQLALAETAVYGQVHKDRLAAFVQSSEQRADAHRKKIEELNRPSPPLDGNALGRALLKNLGFIS